MGAWLDVAPHPIYAPRAWLANFVRNTRARSTTSPRAASVGGLFVPLGEFEEDHFLLLVIDIVQHAVGPDSQPILGRELRHDESSGQFLRPLALRPWVGCECSDGCNDGFLIIGGNLGERFLKRALDSLAREDDFGSQL